MGRPATPSVSAVIATRHRPELLRRAIRSMLAQEGVALDEVVVVFDQAEPDATLAEEFPKVSVITNTNTPGLAGARNAGIAQASGEWIAFCDDDDEWMPDRLCQQFQILDEHTEADFVVGGIAVRYGSRIVERVPGRETITFEELLRSRVMEAHPSTFLVRRSAIEDRIGPVDEGLPGSYAEDYDWLLRAARHHPVAVADTAVATIEWHPGSFFGSRWRMIFDALAYMIEKVPEFGQVPAGLARLRGQQAFALAALGERRAALRYVRTTLQLDWKQPRAYMALVVVGRVLRPEWIVKLANSVGRGV